MRIGWHSHHLGAVDVGRAVGQRSHHLALLDEAIDRSATQCLVCAGIRLLKPRIELQLEVERFATRRPSSKFVSMVPCNRSRAPFACGSATWQNSQPTGS